jgi:hypothetical protein
MLADVAAYRGAAPGRWPSAGISPPLRPTRARFSPRARSSPSRTIGLLPAVAAVIAMLIFIKYPLNDEFTQIRDETEARKLTAIKVAPGEA